MIGGIRVCPDAEVTMRLGALLLVLVPAFWGAAATAEPTKATPAAPAAQAAPPGLEYLVGNWSVSARDPGTGETFTIGYRVEPTLGGAWLAGSAEAPELGFRARDIWGLDQRTGEIMRIVFDGSGVYGIYRSRGWQGDTLVLEGEALSKGGATRSRETIRRLGPREFEAVWEALRGGKWIAYSIERVTRT
jgi:hypothetical protein